MPHSRFYWWQEEGRPTCTRVSQHTHYPVDDTNSESEQRVLKANNIGKIVAGAGPERLSEILETVQKLFQFIGSQIHDLRKAKYGFARLTIMASILKDGSISEHFQLVG